MHIFHKWTNWHTVKVDPLHGQRIIGVMTIKRTCATCGKVQARTEII